jgi:hypothetical protein
MTDSGDFLERIWLAISPEGEQVIASIRVSFPRQQPTGDWTASVTLGQLTTRPDVIHGMDSWQAAQLAMQHAAVRIAHLQSLGWHFYWDASDRAAGEVACPSDLYHGVGARAEQAPRDAL